MGEFWCLVHAINIAKNFPVTFEVISWASKQEVIVILREDIIDQIVRLARTGTSPGEQKLNGLIGATRSSSYRNWQWDQKQRDMESYLLVDTTMRYSKCKKEEQLL